MNALIISLKKMFGINKIFTLFKQSIWMQLKAEHSGMNCARLTVGTVKIQKR